MGAKALAGLMWMAGSLVAHGQADSISTANRPKHGAVTYLTLDVLKSATEHWRVEINLD